MCCHICTPNSALRHLHPAVPKLFLELKRIQLLKISQRLSIKFITFASFEKSQLVEQIFNFCALLGNFCDSRGSLKVFSRRNKSHHHAIIKLIRNNTPTRPH